MNPTRSQGHGDPPETDLKEVSSLEEMRAFIRKHPASGHRWYFVQDPTQELTSRTDRRKRIPLGGFHESFLKEVTARFEFKVTVVFRGGASPILTTSP